MTDSPIASLALRLPDPEDETLLPGQFYGAVETAWQLCDRLDLETEIWRGRILRVVRDREQRPGGLGFGQWLVERELSKQQAYEAMALADSADAILETESLESPTLQNFSKRAFVATAAATPEVRHLVIESARQGDRIDRRQVRRLEEEWVAVSSEVLPPEVKTKAAENVLPARYVAPLARELAKLPAVHQSPLQAAIAANPDVETVKQATGEAQRLRRYLEAIPQLRTLDTAAVDLEGALAEALRVDALKTTTDFTTTAAQVEQLTVKLYGAWQRLADLADRLYLESGESTPQLRSLLAVLSPLSQPEITVPLSPERGGTLRLQFLTHPPSPQTADPPPFGLDVDGPPW
ncbi:MAG: hypothetical protein HC918_07570 [Oscillatoriales cyanobacterium SM2_1_8]|nr:hypothetical protein [Oscillatoriales cyanobacterium SM2_1_8]